MLEYKYLQIIKAYLLYSLSLHPLEELHFAKHYCKRLNGCNHITDQMVLTEIAAKSYLQNSLYESGKSSYIKK